MNGRVSKLFRKAYPEKWQYKRAKKTYDKIKTSEDRAAIITHAESLIFVNRIKTYSKEEGKELPNLSVADVKKTT